MKKSKVIWGDGILKQVHDASRPFRTLTVQEIKDEINKIIKR